MLDSTTFEYLKPTTDQLTTMQSLRTAAAVYVANIEANVPSGPDKTYILRKLREVAMWVNVAITRDENGQPRQ